MQRYGRSARKSRLRIIIIARGRRLEPDAHHDHHRGVRDALSASPRPHGSAGAIKIAD
jgi:hypothetical protein